MRGLEKRLAERGIRIEVSDKAFDLLGNVGFDPVYGARPLKRAIQQQLENPLAQKILGGEFVSGDTVRVDAERSEEHTSELQSLMRISYAVFCLKKKQN